jgi:integrase
MKLGKREIDALGASPDGRDRIVFDDEIKGFGLRITPKGTRIFLFQYQAGGRAGQKRRFTLGRYGEITPEQARRAAMALRHRVKAGQDPVAERRATVQAARDAAADRVAKAEADAYTLRRLVEEWTEIGLAGRSASHRAEAPRAIRACLAHLIDRPATAIDQGTAQRAIDGLIRKRPAMARKLRDYGRAMFNWGIRRKRVAANPFLGVEIETPATDRDRVLTDAELGEAWRSAGALPAPFGPFLRLLILTLQRRGELAGMRWGELAPDLATWTIPAQRAKNRTAHLVHLAEPARAILQAMSRGEAGHLVFGATRHRGAAAAPARTRAAAAGVERPISGFSDAKDRLAARICAERATALGVPVERVAAPDWRLHDLRRTGVTVMARLGVAWQVADRVLNHLHGRGVIKGVAAVYQRHEYLAEREAAMRLWADHVLAVAGESQLSGGNVIELRRR